MMRIFFYFILIFVGFEVRAASDFERQEIRQRIQPMGSVTIAEEQQGLKPEEAASSQTTPKVAAEKLSGKEIYLQYCQVCHQSGLAGAPKFKDKSDWQTRLQTKKIDGLTSSAVKGMNAMPPKGTCLKCTDADIRAAIEYMVP